MHGGMMKTNNAAFSTKPKIVKRAKLIGSSSAINMLNLDIDLVADSGFPVLICGEQGSGKKLVSSYIHLASKRAKQALVTFNCASFSEDLLERELFGYVAGAFSSASTDAPGKYQLADGGTLFLDEIDALPLAIQTKLAKVIQSGELQRLGCDESNKFDVRLIAATSKRLAKEVAAGRFNDALYHRLTVYPLQVPNLRDRGTDILLLAEHFLTNIAHILDIDKLSLANDAQQALLAYAWPGNIDELVDLLEIAALTGVEHSSDVDHSTDGQSTIVLDGCYFNIPTSDRKVKSLTTKPAQNLVPVSAIEPVNINVESVDENVETVDLGDVEPADVNADSVDIADVESVDINIESVDVDVESVTESVAAENQIIINTHLNDNNLKQVTDDFQRQFINKMLVENNGNSSATARAIGVDRSNLHRLMKRLEINC